MDRYKKSAIVYSSKTGNTKQLAETIYNILPHESIIYYGEDDPKAYEADRIYIGFWTDKGICDDNTKKFIKGLTNQEVFLFGTAGFAGNGSYFDKIIEKTRKLLPKEAKLYASYMCQGKMPMAVRERYLKMKEQPVHMPNIDELIKNFDKALEHPNQEDLDNFSNWLRKIL